MGFTLLYVTTPARQGISHDRKSSQALVCLQPAEQNELMRQLEISVLADLSRH
jgi:hypothetical protein